MLEKGNDRTLRCQPNPTPVVQISPPPPPERRFLKTYRGIIIPHDSMIFDIIHAALELLPTDRSIDRSDDFDRIDSIHVQTHFDAIN